MRHMIVILSLLLVPELVSAQAAEAPRTLRVLSSNGVRAPLEDVRVTLEAALGYALDLEFSTSAELARRIRANADFDVAILTPTLIEGLITDGYIETDEPSTFARVGVGVGARAGEIDASVETLDGFKAVLLSAESVAFTAEGLSRQTTEAAFERLGIADAMHAKARIVGPGEGPALVAAGGAELVLTLISEIVPVPGLELVGAYPDEVQGYVSFSAGIGTRSSNRSGARRLIEQLTEPPVSNALRARGLEPMSP